MGRKILGFIAVLVLANIVIITSQMISGMIFGMPADLDRNDPASMGKYISTLPVTAFLFVLVGYAVGYFFGGFVMQKIARAGSLWLPLILGGLGTLGWIMNVAMLPHPMWIVVLGFLCFIPFAIFGHKLAGGRPSEVSV